MQQVSIFLLIFKILTSITIQCNEFKLSDSKVLLPRTSFLSINYTIRGSNTICHEWSSGTPEVVAITPVYDTESFISQCSHEAILTSVWQSNHRATATIYAKNIATGHIVKCDVIVDNIHRLTIETRTMELYLHETPEALIAKALDEYGNTFSTLDGIPFEWSVHASGANADGQNVLRLITWTESEYITPVLIGALEKQGLQGYMQLVSGLKTGAARISLVFRDDKLKAMVPSSEVRLLVMANAALSPPLAYLMPHTQLSYKVLVHSQGATQEIKMPNNQYYLKINNTDLAELDSKGSTLTAKKYGQTEVTLIDRNINEDFRHPSSVLYVVEPGFLSFHISPGDNQWVLQSGPASVYVITVRPFDFNSHPIHMSDNMRLSTNIPKEYFEILHASENGTYNVVRAIKDGVTTLHSNFSVIVLQNGTNLKLDTPIVGSQDLTIYPPIVVIPSSIVIPWYPNEKSLPGFQFKATGGSGEFKWMALDSVSNVMNERRPKNISVIIDSMGFVKPQKLGISYVIAADQRNRFNLGVATVSVDPIRSISLLLYKVEVEVNGELDLHLKALNTDNKVMSHCHWLPFEVSIGDSSIIETVKVTSSYNSNVSDSCAIIRVRGINPGFSKVTVSLVKLLTTKSTQDLLITSITIGVYRPTRFIDTCNGFCAIGILSTKLFQVVDGPLPWTLDPSKYFYDYERTNQNSNIIKKMSLTKTEVGSKFLGLLLEIQCIDIGEVDISVVIGNKESLKNPFPTSSIGSVRLSCALPVFMKLHPRLIKTNVSLDCPFENNTDVAKQITVNNKSPLLIEVLFTDRNGYQLDKSESFAINVEIKSLLPKQNVNEVVKQTSPKVEYSNSVKENSLISFRSYFHVMPNDPHVGDIQIKATSNSYRLGKGPKFHLESVINIRISKSMEIEPNKLILYQHKQISGKFTVRFGSGHFVVLPPSPDFLKVNLLHQSLDNNDGNIYEVVQLNIDKTQRYGLIQVTDTCFSSITSKSDNFKSVSVELVRPFKIQLQSLNKVQLGSQISVLLQVFDDTGREFPSEYLNNLDFEFIFHDNSFVISTHSVHSKDWTLSPIEYSKLPGFIFKITGEKVGVSSFSVSLKQYKEVVSNVRKVEVFPPLKLTPKYAVLLEGTELQLSGTGGPHCCPEMIHFSIIKNKTLGSKEATIEFIKGPNGLIRGVFHGAFAVKVKIEISEPDPSNGNQLTMLSQDEGLVGVVQIKSMSIHAPTNRLIAGNSMPLWITFASTSNDLEHLSITGFSLAGKQNDQLSFKWHLNPPQGVITNLGNLLEPTGIQIGTKYLHSGMRIHSLNPGKQKVEISVSGLPHNWLSKDLNKFEPLIAKLNIAVIPKLDLLEPSVAVRTLLLPPSTRVTLKTTLDNEAVVGYTISFNEGDKSKMISKSKIRSGNILETSQTIMSNEEEQFILHIKSSQLIKLNAANEVIANQSLALFVTVKHPSYSMLSPYISQDSLFQKLRASSDSNYGSDVAFLPLGGPFVFRITSHDELGNKFDISPDTTTISYHLHRSDNIAISMSTEEVETIDSKKTPNNDFLSSQKLLQLQGLSSGDNVLQLFYQNSATETIHLTDIVSVPTAPALHCRHDRKHAFIEGLSVKCHAPFANGYWYSSDPDAMAVDSATGEVVFRRQGASNLFYGMSSNMNVNKNVLISNEVTISPASRLTLKVVEGFLPPSNDSCVDNGCFPINFGYRSDSLLVAVYVDSSSMKYDDGHKFDGKESTNDKTGLKSSEESPMECSVDFNLGENSLLQQDVLKSLLNVDLLSVPSEFDPSLGTRQWACHFTRRASVAMTTDQMSRLLLSLASELKIDVWVRLRHSGVRSEVHSVPVVTGYMILMPLATRTAGLVVTMSGEVLTDLRLVLSPATKRILDDGSRGVLLSVVSSLPLLLEVLPPREDAVDEGVWVFPLKAAAVERETHGEVEITISLPLTRQVDKVHVTINITRLTLTNERQQRPRDAHGNQGPIGYHLQWVRPLLCVLFTGAIAIMIVMLVNNFIRPSTDEDCAPVTSLPLPMSPMFRGTHHVWQTSGGGGGGSPPLMAKREASPMSPIFYDYGGRQRPPRMATTTFPR